jgi:hypothetical protein
MGAYSAYWRSYSLPSYIFPVHLIILVDGKVESASIIFKTKSFNVS